jgi:alpha-beta hydrolase superfamily lysophospholipase
MLLKKSHFQTQRGDKLAVYSKESVTDSNRAMIVLHGYAEYVDRYRAFIDRLSKEGFHVFALDHMGHGRSDGKRAYINDFNVLVDDASTWFESLKSAHPTMDWYVFGHSMGGGIALNFALQHQDELKALVLSGPLIKLPANVPVILKAIGRFVAKVAPTLPVVPIDFDLLSRDPEVVKCYKEDPMIYTKSVRAKTAIEMDEFTKRIQLRLHELSIPFWVGHGSLDRITDPAGSKKLHELAGSVDKTLKMYHGLFHEILNEPEGQVVIHEITQWLKKR